MKSFTEAVEKILEDKSLNDNFRPGFENYNEESFANNTFVYYFGQEIFTIIDGQILIPQGIFSITGKQSKLSALGKNYFNTIFTYDGENLLDKLNPYINVTINSFTIHRQHERIGLGENSKKVKKTLTQDDFKLANQIAKEINFSKDEIKPTRYIGCIEGLKNTCEIEHKIRNSLSGIGNMSNPSIEKSNYVLNWKILDDFKLKQVIVWLRKLIILGAINGKACKKEKIFQEKLLSDYYMDINEAVKKYWNDISLFPLEEELVINRDAENSGRVDNLYINKNSNSIIFAEVKYDNNVIETKEVTNTNSGNPGLLKHAIDLQTFLNNKKEIELINKDLKSRLTMSQKLNKKRVQDIDINKLNINDNKFIMICGYTKESKQRVINAIIREIKKFEGKDIIKNLDIILITGLVDEILQDPLKTKDNGIRKLNTFQIKTDKQSIEELEEKLINLKK